MDDADQFDDDDYYYFGPSEIRSALRRLKPQARMAVACRSALRAIPVLTESPKTEFLASRRTLFLACFRGCATAWDYAKTGRLPQDTGYISRSLVNIQTKFESEAIVRTCDAIQSIVDGLGEASESSAFDAIMDSANAADQYAPRKLAQREMFDAAGNDMRALLHGSSIESTLAMRLWGKSKTPAWNASIWRVAAFHLMAAKEDWEPWVAWYSCFLDGSRNVTANVVDVFRSAGILENEWSSPAAANAKLTRALSQDETSNWARALDDSAEIDAPPIAIANDQLQFTASIQPSDAVVALRAGMEAEYSNVRHHITNLKKLASQWIDKDCHPDWHGLKRDVGRLGRLMPADMRIAVGQIAVLWGAGVSVAEYLDQDRQLRSDPNSGNAPSLPANLRSALNAFVQVFAAWLLEFPTAAKREENARSFTEALDRLHVAKRVVGHIRTSNALRKEDLRLLEELIQAAERKGHQGAKAKFWSLLTVRRILFAAGRILAIGATGAVVGGYAESSVLLQRLTNLMLQGEAAVIEFIEDLPTHSREALLGIIERLKDQPE